MKNTWESQKYINVFVSYTNSHKDDAGEFLSLMEEFGICGFLAHADIEPLSKWADEIKEKLRTMDVLVVLLTRASPASKWVDHEIGVAVGRNVPILPVNLESTPPYGIIADLQEVKSSALYRHNRGADAAGKLAPPEIIKLIFGEISKDETKNDKIVETIISVLPNFPEHDRAKYVAAILPGQGEIIIKSIRAKLKGGEGAPSAVKMDSVSDDVQQQTLTVAEKLTQPDVEVLRTILNYWAAHGKPCTKHALRRKHENAWEVDSSIESLEQNELVARRPVPTFGTFDYVTGEGKKCIMVEGFAPTEKGRDFAKKNRHMFG